MEHRCAPVWVRIKELTVEVELLTEDRKKKTDVDCTMVQKNRNKCRGL